MLCGKYTKFYRMNDDANLVVTKMVTFQHKISYFHFNIFVNEIVIHREANSKRRIVFKAFNFHKSCNFYLWLLHHWTKNILQQYMNWFAIRVRSILWWFWVICFLGWLSSLFKLSHAVISSSKLADTWFNSRSKIIGAREYSSLRDFDNYQLNSWTLRLLQLSLSLRLVLIK
jgi:hypothetical protein